MRCLALVLALASFLCAQTASLRGQVTDESGAVVPAASVTLTLAEGPSRSTAADGRGVYTFTGLAPGEYTVRAAAPQLALAQPERVAVTFGPHTLNLKLQVAATLQEVTVGDVGGATVSTEADANASAVVIQGDDLQALSDNPDDLQADLQALAGPAAGPNGGATLVDGFSGGDLPSKESIREVRINQNPFSPEFDKLGLGRIEIFTKPGSDRYRGAADYNFANEFWNSRNPYSVQKAPLRLHEFEGNGGGPLGKRASFTLDAQRNMVDNGSIVNAVTLDPQTLTANPFNSVSVSAQRYTKVSPRVDWQLNARDTLTFRYGYTRAAINDAGVGSFELASRGYHVQYLHHTVQVGETRVVGSTVNETRFQYYWHGSQWLANDPGPEVQVLGAFNGGGAQIGHTTDAQNNFEFQNYASALRGRHSLRLGVRLRVQTEENIAPENFGGTFTFGGGTPAPVLDASNRPVTDAAGQSALAAVQPIERYRRTLLFQRLAYSWDQIRALGGGPTQFTMASGQPGISGSQTDVGVFAGDDWRLRSNLTLSLGLRYETQTQIHDRRDIAPRLAVAWAPGGRGKSKPKTVLRAGFGLFYSRFSLWNTLTAQRYDGRIQKQYVIDNPSFFPEAPAAASLAASQAVQAVQTISAGLRAPSIVQSVFTLERQLPGSTTLAVTYSNTRGVHMLRSRDVNAPLPGSYQPGAPGSRVYPMGTPGPVFQAESSGVYRQHQLLANVNTSVSRKLSLFGSYTLNRAMSDTDGVGTFPANPYDLAGEYGPAATDVRHRMTAGGSISMKWNLRVNPLFVVQSGTPFDITTGSDLYGTTLFNGRPGVASDPGKSGLIRTRYGLLDPAPSPGARLLTRNYGRGPGQAALNVRISETVPIGPERGGGAGKPGRRYSLVFGLSVRNLLNHNNPGPIVGNVTSRLFGQANQIAGAPNGEGFFETANNRRLEGQIRFTF